MDDYIKTLMILITLATLSVTKVASKPIEDEERSIAEITEIQERTINGQTDPDNIPLEMEIKAFGKVYQLKLIQDLPVFSPNFTGSIVTTDANGNNVIQPANNTATKNDHDLNKNLFTDETGQASLHVEKKDGNIHLEGIIKNGIRIETIITDGSRKLKHYAYKQEQEAISVRWNIRMDTESSKITERTLPNWITGGCCIGNGMLNDEDAEKKVKPESQQSMHRPDKANEQITVTPEVLVILDYKISTHFNHDIDRVKIYLAIFYNMVNKRLATISSAKVQLAIVNIVLTASETEAFEINKNGNIAKADETIVNFNVWLYRERNNLNNYQMAFWHTIYNLKSMKSDEENLDSVVNGFSYNGNPCLAEDDQFFKGALVRDSLGTYRGLRATAHETGHLLGLYHDGDDKGLPHNNPATKMCSFDDGYIMGNPQKITIDGFLFSMCSSEQLGHFLKTSESFCLPKTSTQTKLPSTDILPGKFISKNEQCKTYNGKDSIFHDIAGYDICVRLWCIENEKIPGSEFVSDAGALDGTPCGNEMICLDGRCVSSRTVTQQSRYKESF